MQANIFSLVETGGEFHGNYTGNLNYKSPQALKLKPPTGWLTYDSWVLKVNFTR